MPRVRPLAFPKRPKSSVSPLDSVDPADGLRTAACCRGSLLQAAPPQQSHASRVSALFLEWEVHLSYTLYGFDARRAKLFYSCKDKGQMILQLALI